MLLQWILNDICWFCSAKMVVTGPKGLFRHKEVLAVILKNDPRWICFQRAVSRQLGGDISSPHHPFEPSKGRTTASQLCAWRSGAMFPLPWMGHISWQYCLPSVAGCERNLQSPGGLEFRWEHFPTGVQFNEFYSRNFSNSVPREEIQSTACTSLSPLSRLVVGSPWLCI